MPAKRFTNQVGIGKQNLSTGFVQGSNSLRNRLQEFSQVTKQASKVLETQRGQEEAREAIAEGKAEPGKFKRKEAGTMERMLTGGTAAKEYNKALETAYLASLGHDIQEKINEYKVKNIDDIIKFNNDVGGYLTGLYKEVDPLVLNDVKNYAEAKVSQSRMDVHKNTINKNKKIAFGKSIAGVDSFANEAYSLARAGNKDASDEAASRAFSIIDSLVESGDLKTDQAIKMKSGINREKTEQRLRLGLDNILKSEGEEAAFKSLIDMASTPEKGHTPDEWDSFISSAHAGLNQEVARAAKAASRIVSEEAKKISNLEIEINTGKGNAEKQSKEIDDLYNEGKISVEKRTSLQSKVDHNQIKSFNQVKEFTKVSQRLKDNDHSVVLDKKAVDNYYEQIVQPDLGELTPQEALSIKANYVNKTKQVPAALKQEINTYLRSDNPELISQASQLIDAIDDSPDLIKREFTVSDVAFAMQVNELSANLDTEEAIRLAKRLTDPDDMARIENREAIIKKEKLRDGYSGVVIDKFNRWFRDNIDEVNIGNITKEYSDLFESYFKAGISQDSAKEKALKDISRNWSESEVTGKVMKYAPDQFYSVGGDVSYIKQQLAQDVSDSYFKNISIDDIFLQSTEETARSATTGQPTYRVIIRTDEGLLPMVGVKWKPDKQKEEERRMTANEKKKEEDRKRSEEAAIERMKNLNYLMKRL